ncbi:MAG TPA: MarR family transcriptional regulator [Streptosporangiaceae bacterium]|nr:MarR family transcriptional regulator [Streptosporangiaceae bacterium]
MSTRTSAARPAAGPQSAPPRPRPAEPAAAGAAAGDPALPELIDVARLRTALLRLSRRLRRHEVADLTPTQLSALATVSRDGPLRLGDLAAAERIAPSTLTRLVSALEDRGFVGRSPVPGDARAWLISVTELGTVMLDRVRQETTSVLAANLLTLPADQLAALAAALPALEHLADGDRG